ncbi:MAG: hypothetical protein OEV44_13900, partial [Spirochaetota bacterium]|nr:hypothetical protein [Spirochaetota bacterium]
NQIKNLIFFYNDTIIESENDYIIANISKLTKDEKKILKTKLKEYLNISKYTEVDNYLVKYN